MTPLLLDESAARRGGQDDRGLVVVGDLRDDAVDRDAAQLPRMVSTLCSIRPLWPCRSSARHGAALPTTNGVAAETAEDRVVQAGAGAEHEEAVVALGAVDVGLSTATKLT